MDGLVFNIQRFSLHDGPGIRTVVFMKGCPLRCIWCSNPESQSEYPEISFLEIRCLGYNECGLCIRKCPKGAIKQGEKGKIKIERELCNNCGKCVDACVSKALNLIGQHVSVENVMRIMEEDDNFYVRSQGGITISGGEPLMQADFVSDLLSKCNQFGISTAVETSGYGSKKAIEKICSKSDLIFYDIKHMDSIIHKNFTGVGNELILENISFIAHNFPNKSIIVRTPIIPGFNDSEKNIELILNFISQIKNVLDFELLPYHRFGEPKYAQLGRVYNLTNLRPPSKERMEILKNIIKKSMKFKVFEKINGG